MTRTRSDDSVLTWISGCSNLREDGRVFGLVYFDRHRLVTRVRLVVDVVDINLDVDGGGVVDGGGGRVDGRRVGIRVTVDVYAVRERRVEHGLEGGTTRDSHCE